ncbi:MAG TPA: cupin domain-containing protein [Deltaproteobacteria bacterium]|nr:cupin domain-containing protein [Deltaproteobacteria bacterium]
MPFTLRASKLCNEQDEGGNMKVYRLKDVQERELVPGGKVRFVHSDAMTLAFWTFEAGSPLPEHAHHHEQILSVVKGVIEFVINGENEIVEAPASIIIPPNAVHSGKCRTDCTIIDAFNPKRQDFAVLDA